MEQFHVTVSDGDLRAMAQLNAAGIPAIGVFPAYFVEQGPPSEFDLDGLTAIVQASSPDEAIGRVREILVSIREYDVGPAEGAAARRRRR